MDAEPLCGPAGIRRLGKPWISMAEEGRRPVEPFLAQGPADAPDIDMVERAGDGVEAGGIDDDVELVVARAAGCRAR
ncbi:MAG: hypothetical protein U1E60_08935 [Reyranellaceae bacterium]